MTAATSPKHHAHAPSENNAGVAVRAASVDDWAWRKGSNYGAIIVDLERWEVVDALADRSAATTANWFKDHPNVEMVGRDRAGLYEEAACEASPPRRRPVVRAGANRS